MVCHTCGSEMELVSPCNVWCARCGTIVNVFNDEVCVPMLAEAALKTDNSKVTKDDIPSIVEMIMRAVKHRKGGN